MKIKCDKCCAMAETIMPETARDGDATSTVAKGKNGCNLRKMGIFVSNFEKYFVVWGCIL